MSIDVHLLMQSIAFKKMPRGGEDPSRHTSSWRTMRKIQLIRLVLPFCLFLKLVGVAAHPLSSSKGDLCFAGIHPFSWSVSPSFVLKSLPSHRASCGIFAPQNWRHVRRSSCRCTSSLRTMVMNDQSSDEPSLESLIKGGARDVDVRWDDGMNARIVEGEGQTTSKVLEDSDFYDRDWKTPLWMITQEPDLNNLVKYLQKMKDRILSDPDSVHHVRFSRAQLGAARTAFSRMVRRGEMRLHRLCELTGDDIFDKNYARQSVVIGQRPGAKGQGQRFQLVQPLGEDELYALTDLDLGSRQLERFKWQQSDNVERAALVANFVEYEALEVNKWGVFKCISRIKAEEEIWNKVVDEIFEIDNIVKREKELRHLSRFVKDVFGLKIVVGDEEQARHVQQHLKELYFDDESLMAYGVPVLDETRSLKFVEVKDYLTETSSQTKTSGWRALKSVVMWWDTPIEIQLQVLRNYHRERERITKESHSEFKARREELRDLIASSMPLFRFYRDLLQWLFKTTASDGDSPPPEFKNVLVEVTE